MPDSIPTSVTAEQMETCRRERAELAKVLRDLIAASGHISPFGGDASVKGVRRAGKYLAALDRANDVLAKVAL